VEKAREEYDNRASAVAPGMISSTRYTRTHDNQVTPEAKAFVANAKKKGFSKASEQVYLDNSEGLTVAEWLAARDKK